MNIGSAALYAFRHFYHADIANAAIHLAPVKFSPIVFTLAEALVANGFEGDDLAEVIRHKGLYAPDPGR
jgi:hypothetical protein